MSESAVRSAEIAVEQRHIDQVYARLAELRGEAEAMRSRGYELGHGAGVEASFEQASMLLERDVMVHHANRLLQALDTEREGLVFGRIDLDDGRTLYIGRLGVRDLSYDNLVTDWRAPAAAPFYQATPQEPMGVLRRRVIRCSGERVVEIDDDLLTKDPLPERIQVVGEGALMAALGRTRGHAMRDILATIQREQDEVIRAPLGGVTELTGGPGTGKTAVALHRAAYLLYRERRRLGGAGVLVVGPSPVFTNYISRVLPSMGEDTAELRALGEVVDGFSAAQVDSGRAAEIKGSVRMRRLLRRAARQTPPDVPTAFRTTYRGEVLTLDETELAAVRREVHRAVRYPNASRVDAAEAVLEALWRKADRYAAESGDSPSRRPDRTELITEIGERMDFHRFLVRWWPPLTPDGVLGWLRDRDRLAAAGAGFSARDLDCLAESWSTPAAGFSAADVALLDELRVMLGDPPKRRRGRPAAAEPTGQSGRPRHYADYLHIVVDEAQDLSPMQWRMIGRRGRYATWTIVGDPVQSSWPDPAEANQAKDAALRHVLSRRRTFTLRTNYRNPAEVFELAVRALGDGVGTAELPTAVRRTGIEPSQRIVPLTELAEHTRLAVKELLDAVGGTVGVITAMARVEQRHSWLESMDDDRIRVVGSLAAKGMEYDAVVIVDPAEIIAESSTGRRALYVALTRPTQQLIVLAPDDSWLPKPGESVALPPHSPTAGSRSAPAADQLSLLADDPDARPSSAAGRSTTAGRSARRRSRKPR